MERFTVYCLHSARTTQGRRCDRTYVGYTVDIRKRLRQHNGEIKGGAKATRRCVDWRVLWTVQGFATCNHALQLEWRLHHPSGRRRRRGRRFLGGGDAAARRSRDLCRIMHLERFTQSAPPTAGFRYVVTWYDRDAYVQCGPDVQPWPAFIAHQLATGGGETAFHATGAATASSAAIAHEIGDDDAHTPAQEV